MKNSSTSNLIILILGICSIQYNTKSAVGAKGTIVNGSFEISGTSLNDWDAIGGWSGTSGGISNEGYYAPLDGNYYAVQNGGGDWVTQNTTFTMEKGKTYKVSDWVRSINKKENDAKTTAEIEFIQNGEPVVKTNLDVNAPQLKGYTSQDKGTVENRIGVIRRFFPKKKQICEKSQPKE